MISVEEAKSFYEGADSAHDFDHILRVVAMVEKIARAEGADVEVARDAALLHDIARADEDHADVSAERARALLRAHGASEEYATRVANAIRAHRFRGTQQPDSLEGKILFDADKLDAIGALGVARAFAVAGSLKQKLYSEPGASQTATRDQHHSGHSPVAEYKVKLSKLRERFYTPTAQKLAAGRHEFMADFFRRLSAEVCGDD
jgi:uncharacterized protein